MWKSLRKKEKKKKGKSDLYENPLIQHISIEKLQTFSFRRVREAHPYFCLSLHYIVYGDGRFL